MKNMLAASLNVHFKTCLRIPFLNHVLHFMKSFMDNVMA